MQVRLGSVFDLHVCWISRFLVEKSSQPWPKAPIVLYGYRAAKPCVVRDVVQNLRRPARLGVPTHALVVGPVERVPLHQDPRAVRPDPVVDLPGAVLEAWDQARAGADSLPRVLRAGPGPDRSEAVRHPRVLHRDREREVEPVPPLQLPGVVHRADHAFRRNAAVRDHERVQRSRDVPILQRIDQPLKVGNVLVLRVLPEPEAAVGREPALEIRGFALRRVGLVEVVVEHLGE